MPGKQTMSLNSLMKIPKKVGGAPEQNWQGNIVAKTKLRNVLQVPLLYVGLRVGEDQLTMLVRETEILR